MTKQSPAIDFDNIDVASLDIEGLEVVTLKDAMALPEIERHQLLQLVLVVWFELLRLDERSANRRVIWRTSEMVRRRRRLAVYQLLSFASPLFPR